MDTMRKISNYARSYDPIAYDKDTDYIYEIIRKVIHRSYIREGDKILHNGLVYTIVGYDGPFFGEIVLANNREVIKKRIHTINIQDICFRPITISDFLVWHRKNYKGKIQIDYKHIHYTMSMASNDIVSDCDGILLRQMYSFIYDNYVSQQ